METIVELTPSMSEAQPSPDDEANIFRKGFRKVPTHSSVLVSSSPYLNSPGLREWIATESLRRNGADYPNLYGLSDMLEAADKARDIDKVETLIKAERRKNPALDRWFEERFISTYSLEDLGNNPPGSIGRQLYEHMTSLGLSMELDPRIMANPNWKPTYDIEYYNLRSGQTHDFDHLLGEVGFDVVGELFPTGLRTGNIFTHVSPELASELLLINTLNIFPWLMRSVLHYGAAWPAVWKNLSHGYEVGQKSDLLFTVKYEDLLALPPVEVRKAIGVRGFQGPVDSRAASLVFGEGRTII